MENNKLSIYREVLVFPCDILNLQEKLDQLITLTRLCGYDIELKTVARYNLKYLHVSKKGILNFAIDFNYDLKNECIRTVNFYYDTESTKLKNIKIRGQEVDEVIGEFDKILKAI